MATRSGRGYDREMGQAGPLIAGIGTCTVLLTASFLGMVALVSGSAVGLLARMPVYVLGGSLSFVGVMLVVDHSYSDGTVVLYQAAAAAAATFVVTVLGAEGVLYALTNPGAVVTSHLFVYLLSGAIIASGLGYWAMLHWTDVRTVASDAGL